MPEKREYAIYVARLDIVRPIGRFGAYAFTPLNYH